MLHTIMLLQTTPIFKPFLSVPLQSQCTSLNLPPLLIMVRVDSDLCTGTVLQEGGNHVSVEFFLVLLHLACPSHSRCLFGRYPTFDCSSPTVC